MCSTISLVGSELFPSPLPAEQCAALRRSHLSSSPPDSPRTLVDSTTGQLGPSSANVSGGWQFPTGGSGLGLGIALGLTHRSHSHHNANATSEVGPAKSQEMADVFSDISVISATSAQHSGGMMRLSQLRNRDDHMCPLRRHPLSPSARARAAGTQSTSTVAPAKTTTGGDPGDAVRRADRPHAASLSGYAGVHSINASSLAAHLSHTSSSVRCVPRCILSPGAACESCPRAA